MSAKLKVGDKVKLVKNVHKASVYNKLGIPADVSIFHSHAKDTWDNLYAATFVVHIVTSGRDTDFVQVEHKGKRISWWVGANAFVLSYDDWLEDLELVK